MDDMMIDAGPPASNLALAALRMETTLTAEQMATALSAPAAVRRMGLDDFYILLADGDVQGETLHALWLLDGFVDRVEAALAQGSLKALSTLVGSVEHALPEGVPALVEAVIASITLRAVDAAWAEIAGPRAVAPESVTAEEVTAALTEAGYAWTGSEWAHN
jgi:hypothetical protein